MKIVNSSGSAELDETIETTIRTTWRFRSQFVHGEAVAVCADLVLICSVKKATGK